MPNPFPNNTALIRVVWHVSGFPEQRAICTFGCEKGAAGDATTLAVNVYSSLAQSGSLGDTNIFSDLYVLHKVEATLMLGGVPTVGEVTPDDGGSSGYNTLPVNCCILVKKRTAIAGRKGRGRMFLPPIYFGEEDVDMFGAIGSSNQEDVQDALDVFKTHMNTTLGIDMLLFHNDGVTAPTEVTSLTCEPFIATQRRRMHRV